MAGPAKGTEPGRGRRLGVAVFLIAGAVNLQLPLYGAYAEAAGLRSAGMSLLLAGYVGALLPCLVLLGGASDRLGRRPLVLAGVAASLIATVVVAAVPGATTLGIARWFQGLGVGLGFAAATAWRTELAGAATSARTTSLASTAGFGFGALVTAGELALHDSVRPWVWALWALALFASGVAVHRLPSQPPVAPEGAVVRFPAYPAGSLVPALSIGVGWGVAGIVVAVLPGVLDGFAPAWSGVVLFALLASAVLVQGHARRLDDAVALRIGAVVLPVGVGVLAIGVALGSVGLVLAGAAIAGTSSHGYGYVGGLGRVNRLGDSAARSVAGYFLAAYLGFGLPAVAMGAVVDAVGAATAFGGLAVLVAGLSAATLRTAGRSAAQPG